MRQTVLAFLLLLSACGGGSSPAKAPSETGQPASAELVSIDLDVRQMTFEKHGFRLLQSSNYYPGVRSGAGHALYVSTFPEHNVVRVNAFDWAAVASSGCVPGVSTAGGTLVRDYTACLAHFERVLKESKPYLDDLTRRNSTRILMVDIFRTPAWLSRSSDRRLACGGGVLANAHRPVDYQVWRQLLEIAVRFFRQYDGAVGVNPSVSTKIHYQFWNEPDLACNWQEDTAAFFELYEQTASHLRARHPGARVGGPGTESWGGRIPADGAARPRNLAFDLVDFARARALPLDFLSWHYFSADYRSQLVDGVAAYRAYLQDRGIAEADLPLIINEWLPQDGPPTGLHRYLAPDAANALLAFFETKIAAQGGVPWQDYGPARSDAWGIVAFNDGRNEDGLADAQKKPIFHVVELFDLLSRTSQGLHVSRQDIVVDPSVFGGSTAFKVGERAFLVSREGPMGCYRLAGWNRIASPEQGAIAFLMAQGVSAADLQRVYGREPQAMLNSLIAAIRAGAAFEPRWSSAFRQAQIVERWLTDLRDKREFAYAISISNGSQPVISEARSIGRDGVFIQDKSMTFGPGPTLTLGLKPEEVVHARVCGVS